MPHPISTTNTQQEVVPLPDPTVLTTAQLLRQINGLNALMEAKFHGYRESNDSRFDGITREFSLIESRRVEQKIDCVEANTPILCADLIWRPAGELKVGDELIACDEEPPLDGAGAAVTRGRRFRRAVVTANSIDPDDLLEVSTARGKVRCNPRHPFLARQRSGLAKQRWAWVKASDLKVGDELLKPVDVWEVDRSWEGGWLAGMYDGEGCLTFATELRSAPRLDIVQRDSPTGDLIHERLSSIVDDLKLWHRTGHETWSDRTQYVVTNRPDVMRVLGSIRPPRLLVHVDRTWEGAVLASNYRTTRVDSVTPVGDGYVASLSTSTNTYIANGFAVHNTKVAVDAALSAAEKAVREQTVASEKSIIKSETSSAEQSKQQNATFTASIKGVQDTVVDLKERFSKLENTRLGATEAKDTQRLDMGMILSFGFFMIALVSIAITIVTMVMN